MWKILSLALLLLAGSIFGSPTQNQNPTVSHPCAPGCSCTASEKCSNRTINIHGTNIINYRSAGGRPCAESTHVCCQNEYIREGKNLPFQPTVCGYRDINDNTGTEAKFAEIPWVVAIFLNTNTQKFIGGGSILSPTVVLTAAHTVCPQKIEDIMIRAGELDTENEVEPDSYQNRAISQKYCHEKFNSTQGYYDVAIMTLKIPLDFTYYVKPLCLPREFEAIQLDSRCIVAGWGKDKFGDEYSTRHIMRKVHLPIVPHEECQQKLRKTALGTNFELHYSFICAGGEENVDSCTGDGESALFCPMYDHSNQYFQLGIVSWGVGCNQKQVPAVYANVFNMQSWIRNVLKTLYIDPNYYTPSFTMEYFNREQYYKNY